jgi:hypothetical protein
MLKTTSKKLIVTLACVLLTVFVGVGATLAYLFAQTPPLENTFTPVFLTCETQGNVKTGTSVKNTGELDGYIRVSVVCSWVSESGNTVHANKAVEGTDYTATWNTTAWIKGTDGFYYYVSPVKAGETTEVLVSGFTRISQPPQGYTLTVQINATAIQAEPAEAVTSAWGVTVLENGNISA